MSGNSSFSNNSGSYAQFVVTDSTYVFPLHPRLTFAQVLLCSYLLVHKDYVQTHTKGASLGVPFFTAYKALILRAKTKPGETVLVHGARYCIACEFEHKSAKILEMYSSF